VNEDGPIGRVAPVESTSKLDSEIKLVTNDKEELEGVVEIGARLDE
jgi:hypothetical protein